MTSEQWNYGKTYKASIESICPECEGDVVGEGIFATGETLVYENSTFKNVRSYTPREGEMLKNIWQECVNGDWDQYS
jgi:hypothetical protein